MRNRHNQLYDLGDPEKLKEVGVECKVDLPGVGLNFQDHYLTFSVYRAKPGTESFDEFVRGNPEVQKRTYHHLSH
jgi:alcohol oxidase